MGSSLDLGAEAMASDFQVRESVAPADNIPVESSSLDLVGILSAVQVTAYFWDLLSDRMEWESNVGEVLGVADTAEVASGTAFHFLIAPEHIERRRQAILGLRDPATGDGFHYRIQYRFMPDGRRSQMSLWLEDHGRCWFDATGRPIKARIWRS